MKTKQTVTEDPSEATPLELSDGDCNEEEIEAPVKTKRSKPADTEDEEGMVYRPVKLSRNDLYRPPTADELNQLKEAESLFHCSLLKMQMEELLKEVALSEHRKRQIDSFLQTVTRLMQSVPESPEVDVSDLSWLSGEVKVPFLLIPKITKGKFHMAPPASVDLIGSYPLGTCTKPHVMVDMAVTIPTDVLHPKDVLNQRYPRKRALYLTGLAQHLASSSAIGTMHYSCLHGNRLRPVLLLTPAEKDSSSFTVRVHVCLPPGFFKPNRFHPQRNNIRTEWYTGLQTTHSASTDLTVNGISLARKPDSTVPSLEDFHNAFQVVFVDPSGHLNLCADMTTCTYKRLQHEASLSMQFWDNPTVDGFQCLLMTPKPMIRTSDHVFQLCELAKLQGSCKKLNLLNELMDRSGDYIHAVLPFILSLLLQGLDQRIYLLTHSLSSDPKWPVDSEAPKYKTQPPLTFGLLLKPEFADSVLERGPPADNLKAVEFRQLWGPRSELRRFQDGAMTEAVLWDGKSTCQKRLVPRQIITHLLDLHADVPDSCVRYVGTMVDDVIATGSEVPSTGEDESLVVIQAFDDLSRKLWKLEDLPLSITAVQGAHPALRYSQVFPPRPLKLDYSFFDRDKISRSLLPKEAKPCPAYITPIKVICHMEGSGKWPHDRLAVCHIRAAFHIKLGELLKKHHNYTCRPCPTHLDVWKDGFVFRIQVAYHREPQILRESVNAEGLLVVRDNEEARALEMATIHKPLLTSTLHGLQQQHPCFGAVCRLAKRWLGAQLFSDDITEDTADLLVASLFLQPAPFTPPSSPQVGFLRFLHLLSSFDWRNNPLIVNLNDQLTAADYTEIKNEFMASRESLPVMFIATPKDKKLSLWTKQAPSIQMLQRVMVVATESLKVLEHQLIDGSQPQDVRVIMRPPLDDYDVVIHLNPKQVPLLNHAVDPPVVTFSRGVMSHKAAPPGGPLPVVDYNPVSVYLAELRDAFGDLALFFCDPYGGTVIVVLWKPKAFEPAPFKTSQVSARSVKVTGDQANTIPNVEAILEDFHVMGKGLVKSVEAKTEKWSV
ncbi:nucleolar protein 6 isoform 2-T2 [Pholidichthys leucotaenia]